MWYNEENKRINADHPSSMVVGHILRDMPGGKEITVGIRGNSHYRISRACAVKSECLSICDP